MAELSEIKYFADSLCSIRETSIDSSHGKDIPMIDSDYQVVDFDKVKDAYSKNLHIPVIPKSNDAMFEDGKGDIIFVEFKNCVIDGKLKPEIRKKIYDSLLIFSDITSKSLTYMREHAKYFLVYNESENMSNPYDDTLKEKNAIQNSQSYNFIVKDITGLAKRSLSVLALICSRDTVSRKFTHIQKRSSENICLRSRDNHHICFARGTEYPAFFHSRSS